MRIGILQPGYLPWLGFFDQMDKVDLFILLDTVQYTKNDWRNRNRIKTFQGMQWLTVPISFKLGDTIAEALVVDSNWRRKHLRALELNYGSAKYFDWLFPDLKILLQARWTSLSKLNFMLLSFLKKKLSISTKLVLMSYYIDNKASIHTYITDKSKDIKPNMRLVNICKEFGATEFLEGKSGCNYMDIKLFEKNGIHVEFHDFKHPVYPQLHGEFIPYLSIVDLLFNCGDKSLYYLRGNR